MRQRIMRLLASKLDDLRPLRPYGTSAETPGEIAKSLGRRIPLFVEFGDIAPLANLPFEERKSISAIVRNPRTGTYLGLRWKGVGWETFVTGGIEHGQTPEQAAIAEIRQETGYKNLQLVRTLPPFDAQFYHAPKQVNRHAHAHCFLFDLIDDARDEIAEEELARHEPVWLTRAELEHFRLPTGHRYILGFV